MLNPIRTLSCFVYIVLLVGAIGAGYRYFLLPAVEIAQPVQPPVATASNTKLLVPLIKSVDKNATGNKTLVQLKAKLSDLQQQLKAQQQKNTRQVMQIENLSTLLANKDFENDISCDDESEEEMVSAEELEQELALIAQQTDLFERTLSKEPADDDQSQKLTAEIDGLLKGKAIIGSTLDNVECGESLCRVALQHQDVDAQDVFISISQILLEMRGDGFTDIVDYGDGTKGTILYLAREGFSLPDRNQPEEG